MEWRFSIAVCVLCLVSAMPAGGKTPEPAERPAAIISRIPREPVQSTALAAVGYSKRLRALEVEFGNGAIYRYLEVPPFVHRNLMSSESKAHFYDMNVRGKYRCLHVKPRAGDH